MAKMYKKNEKFRHLGLSTQQGQKTSHTVDFLLFRKKSVTVCGIKS